MFHSEEEEEEELPLLTDEEMNKLGARLVKAEILGNTVSPPAPQRPPRTLLVFPVSPSQSLAEKQ